MHSETVDAQGHLIDSGDLQAILTTIVDHGASYVIQRFDVGRTNDDVSRLSVRLTAAIRRVAHPPARKAAGVRLLQPDHLGRGAARGRHRRRRARGFLLDHQSPHRAARRRRLVGGGPAAHGRRHRRLDDRPRARRAATATCRKLRDLRRGDRVVCGMAGVRVLPDIQSRDKPSFGFMSNEVSSERRVETAVARVAEQMRTVRRAAARSRSSPARSSSTPAAPSISAS